MDQYKVDDKVISDILELANGNLQTKTFFFSIISESFNVVKVYNTKNGSHITEGLTLPLESSI